MAHSHGHTDAHAHPHDHPHHHQGTHVHGVRVLTTDECRRVDRLATEQYGLPSLILMENAGRSVAELATELMDPAVDTPSVLILAGHGNNGGDGFVAGRHLSTIGVRVGIILALPEDQMSGDARTNLAICRKFGIPIKIHNPEKPMAALRSLPAWFAKPAVVIDALLGIGQQGNLREPYAALAGMCNQLGDEGAAILAVDVPTGLNADTGDASPVCVRAHLTVCLVAPKPGMFQGDGPGACGNPVVGDIGVPYELVERFGEVIEFECNHDHGDEDFDDEEGEAAESDGRETRD